MKDSPPFEFLEHTADIQIRARGSSLEQLFSAAAQGMTEYLFGPEALKLAPDKNEKLEATGQDPEALLVEWLSKLLLMSSLNRRAYVQYEFAELSRNLACAYVASAEAKALEEIKAVTYHNLNIEKVNGLFEAIITFDI